MRPTSVFALAAAVVALGGCGGPTGSTTVVSAEDLYARYDDGFEALLREATATLGREVLVYEPIAPGLLAKKITISGSPRELGHLVGWMARRWGIEPARRTPASADVNDRITRTYEALYPAFLDKAAGVARAYDMSVDALDLRDLEHDFFQRFWMSVFHFDRFFAQAPFGGTAPGHHCSLASYDLAGPGAHLVGRNFDNGTDRPHFLVATALTGVYRTIGMSVYAPHHQPAELLNEKGLYVGVASVDGPPEHLAPLEPGPPGRPATQVIHLMRMVAETCATVDEALELMSRTTVWFPVEIVHLLVADAQGRAVVVEWDTDGDLVPISTGAPYALLTNTALQGGLDPVLQRCPRFRTALPMLAAGIRDVQGLVAVTEAMRLTSGPTQTLWTSVADLSSRELDLRFRSEGFARSHRFGLDGRPRQGAAASSGPTSAP